MKQTKMATLIASLLIAPLLNINLANAAEKEQEKIEALTKRIEALEKALQEKNKPSDESKDKVQGDSKSTQELEKKVEQLAELLDTSHAESAGKPQVSIGGYGEMHYNILDANSEDVRELDFHRMVLFFGYEFNDWARFVSELEVEHIIASGGSRGAVELEQVYVEMDISDNMHLKTGAMLMPIGIINETHEPTTFYGVERPIVETTIIPTTWWSAGAGFTHKLDNGFSYDAFITEGLKTDDPASGGDPFDIKGGKQKGSFASAYELAVTGRVKYTGIPGVELAGYFQYQPDLDQSAEENYADSATLIGGHVIYQWNDFTFKSLYARWELDGDLAYQADRHVQEGGYVEADWKLNENWGVFARHSVWSTHAEIQNAQSKIGVNFYPFEHVVFKADYQLQNDEAGNVDGLNLGFGYAF